MLIFTFCDILLNAEQEDVLGKAAFGIQEMIDRQSPVVSLWVAL
jgi:hypothetical protein